ncbi:MAG: DUF3226 domain-containing protein [Thermoguttaceae bacterium]|jgi:hypothetical protein
MPVPTLYVEGKDDISVISNLLLRHGVDTECGNKHLKIQDKGGVDSVLDFMPDVIRSSTEYPVGFVIDIDIKVIDRWNSVSTKLREVGITPPDNCPSNGFFGQLPEYQHRFGVWLMPDCTTDYSKMEHIVQSLIPQYDPLWSHAQQSVTHAMNLVGEANKIIAEEEKRWKKFRDVDRIKAEVHTWLAWQRSPGVPFGTAIKERILGHDSPQAINFLRWIKDLYGLPQLVNL